MPIPLSLLRAIVVCVASSQQKKEEQQGMHYMDFNPYVIRERNDQMHSEVNSLRLEKQSREHGGSSGSRFVAFAKRSVMPLLHAAHLAG
jgi:hypothetical protein